MQITQSSKSTRFQKGQVPHNKTEHIKKTCPKCQKQFSVRPSWDYVVHCSKSCSRTGEPSPMKGKKSSESTKLKQRKAKLGIRGPEHWNWKDGSIARKKRHLEMGRDEYIQWRKEVFNRDKYVCQNCFEPQKYIQAHHIKPWKSFPSLRYEISNGITLCKRCHQNKHFGSNKGELL